MRLVRYAPNERVDLPDITAMSTRVHGEFRRMIRTMFAGGLVDGTDAKKILKGFEVIKVDSTNLKIDLDINGDGTDLSAAVLPHKHDTTATADVVEQGQLVGDQGWNREFEGTASTANISTAGLSDGTNVVRIRYTEQTGESGNRAFWTPASGSTGTEGIQSTDTLYEPVWEYDIRIGAAPAPAGQWIDLASVEISSGSIVGTPTDLRDFAIEGTRPFVGTTPDFTTGVGDFNRSAFRELPTIGINAVWPMLRALARQVQDIKGPTESGFFDWFSRPPHPNPLTPSDATNGLFTESARSLRSINDVTFTVANGADDWGDFNGTDGLQKCLDHIAANQSDFSSHVRIHLKGGKVWSTGPFVITSQVTITQALVIEIIGMNADGDDDRVVISNAIGTTDLPIISVSLATSGGAGTEAGVILRNVEIVAADDEGAITIVPKGSGAQDGKLTFFRMYNSVISCALATVSLRVPSHKLVIEDSEIYGGGVFIGGTGLDGAASPGRLGTGFSGHVRNTLIVGQLRLRWQEDMSSIALADIDQYIAVNVEFSRCVIRGLNPTLGAVEYFGLHGSRSCSFLDCQFYGFASTGTLNMLGMGALDLSDGLYPLKDLRIKDCVVSYGGAGTTFRMIHLYNQNATAPTLYNEVNENIRVEGCDFVPNEGTGVQNETSTSLRVFHAEAPYSRNVYFERNNVMVRDEDVGGMYGFWWLGSLSTRDGTPETDRNIFVNGNTFVRRGAVGVSALARHVTLQNVRDSEMCHNKLRGPISANTSDYALLMSGAVNCLVLGNVFDQWAVASSTTSTVCVRVTNIQSCIFSKNTFIQCGGNVIYALGICRENLLEGNKFRVSAWTPAERVLHIPNMGQTTNAMINFSQATFIDPGNAGIETDVQLDTFTCRQLFVSNSWDKPEETPSALYRVIAAGKDRYASFASNHFIEARIVLQDYATPVPMPDTARQHGFDTTANTLAGVTVEA